MDTDHDQPENLDKKFKLGFLLNTGFMIFEFIVGLSINSLALISDAAHNLTDSITLVISFIASHIGKRQANAEKTFGYGRATIMAALFNAVILIVIAGYIFFEAYQRLLAPEPVRGGFVAAVAAVGIAVNATVALMFKSNRDDLNVRSAYLNMAFDALASVGALVAGLFIVLTGKSWIDPLIGSAIGVMLLYGAWSVARSAVNVLLEGMPEGIDVEKVRQTIGQFQGVKAIDDLHIWAISSRYAALSCHLVMSKQSFSDSAKLLSLIKEMLSEKFDIVHATIEVQSKSGPHDNERTDEGL